jgi:uncharacterized membrane protein YozB (DUF420 family)
VDHLLLSGIDRLALNYRVLPGLNAALNATAALLLLAGWRAIRHGNVQRHRRLMLGAVFVSVAFLASYLTYHVTRQLHEGVGHTKFAGPAALRPVYFGLLLSHLVLAMVNLPMILATLGRALRGRYELHRRIARKTWPVWMYVSVTGVIVYLMLYHL